jgi:sulfhydrogenase subunit beta (sulfur reductase)
MNFISRKNLTAWLDNQAKAVNLVAPRMVDKILLYRKVGHSDEVTWGAALPVQSIKDVFFPPTERLLTIRKNANGIQLAENLSQNETIVFGVRPCDARGMVTLDALFLETEPVDSYYAHRRENTTLVGLACQEMGDTCFCTSIGGGPQDTTGMDLMLTEVDGGYLVDVVTDKGAGLLESLQVDEKSMEKPAPPIGEVIPVPEGDAWPSSFESAFWSNLSERCLSCRICAYVCPTCRCFDVRDEALPASNGGRDYERIRCWDSCAGEVYRRIAGGHNPREAKAERLRNRFLCKFYYFAEQYGPTACTGCGRCIQSCPVNIDITEVLRHVVEVTP